MTIKKLPQPQVMVIVFSQGIKKPCKCSLVVLLPYFPLYIYFFVPSANTKDLKGNQKIENKKGGGVEKGDSGFFVFVFFLFRKARRGGEQSDYFVRRKPMTGDV